MSLLSLSNICKVYGKGEARVKALDQISLTVEKGEMVAVTGASGSGKSTLLNIIGCIDRPTQGTYFYEGKDVAKFSEREISKMRNENFGFVIQNFALVDDYTVMQNVIIPLHYSHKSFRRDRARVKNLLMKLGIQEKMNEKAYNLSGGQRQRVAIARAIVNEPTVILADEPTGALDSSTSKSIMKLFQGLNEQGLTSIIVTHSEAIAKCCKRQILIRDGKIIQDRSGI